jgi:hypothetical protein
VNASFMGSGSHARARVLATPALLPRLATRSRTRRVRLAAFFPQLLPGLCSTEDVLARAFDGLKNDMFSKHVGHCFWLGGPLCVRFGAVTLKYYINIIVLLPLR